MWASDSDSTDCPDTRSSTRGLQKHRSPGRRGRSASGDSRNGGERLEAQGLGQGGRLKLEPAHPPAVSVEKPAKCGSRRAANSCQKAPTSDSHSDWPIEGPLFFDTYIYEAYPLDTPSPLADTIYSLLPHLRSGNALRGDVWLQVGLLIWWKMTPPKPSPCRVHAFIDWQNLYHSVKRIFGYEVLNCDPLRLAQAVTNLTPDRQLIQVHFYTGIPRADQARRLNAFWSAKVRAMENTGIRVVTRKLVYSPGLVLMPDDSVQERLIGREKGIDLRMALDILRLARYGEFDVVLLFSQDGDLAEVAHEIRNLREELNRWLVIDCAYPHNPASPDSSWGIGEMRHVPFEKTLYDTCIDP